jgi:NADPH:quinone reductase-like Zn-dependent oxidoreductase
MNGRLSLTADPLPIANFNPGTFAEYISVPKEDVTVIPSNMSYVEAASLPIAAVTAYRAVFSLGGLKKGQKVLIPGIGGGVALFALQFAVAAGAEVYVTSSSEEKIKKAIALGAAGGVNYRKGTCNKPFIRYGHLTKVSHYRRLGISIRVRIWWIF